MKTSDSSNRSESEPVSPGLSSWKRRNRLTFDSGLGMVLGFQWFDPSAQPRSVTGENIILSYVVSRNHCDGQQETTNKSYLPEM